MTKRVMVTFDDEQYQILNNIKGLGLKDAEKVRNIVIAYFSEKGYIKDASVDDRLKNLQPYSYSRFTWYKDINVDNEAERLSKDFEIKPLNTPEPSEREVSIYKNTRKEIIIKADTLGAIISTFRAILYQKEKAPFTTKDMKLRQEILDLYPRRSASPLPIGYSFEPKFIIADADKEIK
jgi:hypothetical protein